MLFEFCYLLSLGFIFVSLCFYLLGNWLRGMIINIGQSARERHFCGFSLELYCGAHALGERGSRLIYQSLFLFEIIIPNLSWFLIGWLIVVSKVNDLDFKATMPNCRRYNPHLLNSNNLSPKKHKHMRLNIAKMLSFTPWSLIC